MGIELRELTGPGGVAVVIALVGVMRGAAIAMKLPLPKGLSPALAVLLGIAWQLLLAFALKEPRPDAVIAGVLTGLAASGLWSGGKALVGR